MKPLGRFWDFPGSRRQGLINLLVWVGIVVVSVSMSTSSVRHVPFLNMAENWLDDSRLALFAPEEPQHPEIVIVSINEETIKRFPYRSPIDRGFLAALLKTLEQKGARGVLLDILLDQPTETKKDAALKNRLSVMKIPLVISYGMDHTGTVLTQEQTAFLNQYVAEGLRGLANLSKDTLDGTVRWIFSGDRLPGGTYIRGVARAMAAKLGLETPNETPRLAWRGAPGPGKSPFRTFPAHLVPLLPDAWFKGQVILVGVDLSLTDRHRTPMSAAARWEGKGKAQGTPGVVVHAHGLAQLLDQRPFPGLSTPTRLAVVFGTVLLGLMLASLPFNLYLIMVGELLALCGYWVVAFVLFQKQGVLLPLLAPTIGATIAYGLSLLHIGTEARRGRRLAREETQIKAELLANMSHEIRTPINAVIGMTELVLEAEKEAAKRKHLSIVLSSAKSLLRLINDILDYSKMESGRMVFERIVFDLRQSLEETLATLMVQVQAKGLSLNLQVDENLPKCFSGDPVRLRQVVVNLVGNAIKFTEKGVISVQVFPEPGPEPEPEPGQWLRFAVADTGIGIPADRLEAIFESYAQAEGSTARKHGGTGLGTTISKQIVEGMEGRIWVESRPGQGSTFYFVVRIPSLPGVTVCGEEAESVAPEQALGMDRRTFNILLADDIEENLTLATIRLQQQGHAVTTVRDGLQALSAFEQGKHDLILMDVNMPLMGGLEATRAIRGLEKKLGHDRRIPIIALTAGTDGEDKRACTQAGMDAFAAKPIEFGSLFALLERVVPEGLGSVIAAKTVSVVDRAPRSSPEGPDLPPLFQGLDGIDARRGLATWGNAEEYRKSLVGFSRQHAEDMVLVRAALSRDDVPAAKAVSHGLKGVAGTLATLDLASSASVLDAALHQRKGEEGGVAALNAVLALRDQNLDDLINVVEKDLQAVLYSCDRLVSKPKKKSPVQAVATQRIEDVHVDLLRDLADQMTRGAATHCERLLRELESSGIAAEEELSMLVDFVEDFDFLQASAALKKLAATLDIDLEKG